MAADWSRESLLVALGRPDRPGEAVNAALALTSTYRAGGERVYARDGTPTWAALEAVIGALEGGEAVAFASGMAASAAVLEALPAGARVVVSKVAYHGVHVLLEEREAAGRLSHVRVDALDLAAVQSACEGAALLWLETPMNPLIAVADIAALSAAAHARGAAVLVDSTLATPLRQQPLDLGADLVLHSATKYIGGHSDLLLGIVAAKDGDRIAALLHRRQIDGSTPGSLEAFLALRGVRTLAVRLERAEQNAGELARRLDAHAAVTRVRYPGLDGDPGHDLAARQMSGFGAMLAFETTSDAAAAERVCDAVELITHATSLGGVETLLERRARYPAEEASGVPPTLIRLSVGIEDVDDLWRDLERALAAV
ncbi:MAG TPA: PLP-dependent transferase [Solirubrobacteraceae bacterium]|nr:PLP-dependent transferase [Solirubrobacteraceae bacterium]